MQIEGVRAVDSGARVGVMTAGGRSGIFLFLFQDTHLSRPGFHDSGSIVFFWSFWNVIFDSWTS